MAHAVAEYFPSSAVETESTEATVMSFAQALAQKAVAAVADRRAPDFGPYGIGRLPNALDGYPDPCAAAMWHEDFSVYTGGEYPAYILAGHQDTESIVAC